jgi:hypothetical protein
MQPNERHHINRIAGAGNSFTQDEMDRSRNSPDYSDVTPEMLFGPRADARLAMEIRRNNPIFYSQAKTLYKIQLGELPRPPR